MLQTTPSFEGMEYHSLCHKTPGKELKDKEFKELFAATDTIPNHVKQSSSSTKHESKEGHGKSSSHRKPSEDHSGTSKSKSSDSKKGEHGSHSSSHHGSHHHGHGSHHGSSHSGSHSSSSHHGDKSTHHKSSSSNKDTNKRRLSDADHPPEMGPKNKVPKVTENVSFGCFYVKKSLLLKFTLGKSINLFHLRILVLSVR